VQLLACCASLVILAAAANLVTPEAEGGLDGDWTRIASTQARDKTAKSLRKGKDEQLTINKAIYPYVKESEEEIDKVRQK